MANALSKGKIVYSDGSERISITLDNRTVLKKSSKNLNAR